jgi:predicted ATPase
MNGEVPKLRVGSRPCRCPEPFHDAQLVVVMGGPGAGKTAVLELAAHIFCRHVAILPEAATIIFGGGFPRHDSAAGLAACQRATFAVRRQLEALVVDEGRVGVALCDRGTIDGRAYWPESAESFWDAMGTTSDEELARYMAVIHLQTPPLAEGYHQDRIRTETVGKAREIDRLISAAWAHHPRRVFVPPAVEFSSKSAVALAAIRATLPSCCRSLELASI